MRLADQIAASVGGREDRICAGAITSVARDLQRCEKFDLTRDVVKAASYVSAQKPSTLLQAVRFCRFPFPLMWFEWNPADLEGRDETPTDDAPQPARMGCLLQPIAYSEDVAGLTFMWSHKQGRGLWGCPYAGMISWRPNAIREMLEVAKHQPVPDILRAHGHGNEIDDALIERMVGRLNRAEAAKVADKMSKWRQFSDNDRELDAIGRLGEFVSLGVSPHWVRFIFACEQQGPQTWAALRDRWEQDITGEPRFVQSVLAILNTRNGAELEREDLSRLNRARAKNRKPPLFEYHITRLALSRHAARQEAQGRRSHAELVQEKVRGHFKVRKTGIFWWSPYTRNKDAPTISSRAGYRVVA